MSEAVLNTYAITFDAGRFAVSALAFGCVMSLWAVVG